MEHWWKMEPIFLEIWQSFLSIQKYFLCCHRSRPMGMIPLERSLLPTYKNIKGLPIVSTLNAAEQTSSRSGERTQMCHRWSHKEHQLQESNPSFLLVISLQSHQWEIIPLASWCTCWWLSSNCGGCWDHEEGQAMGDCPCWINGKSPGNGHWDRQRLYMLKGH